MFLTGVTLTGADSGTNPESLIALSKRFPFVEWGILVGTHWGTARWPRPEWFDVLTECVRFERPGTIRLALHLCGEPLRDVLNVGQHGPILQDAVIRSLPFFRRVQLNFHGQPIARECAPRIVEAFRCKLVGKVPIVQLDGVNDWVLDHLLDAGVHAHGLYDKSHGGGVLADMWPSPNPQWEVGYAGGLGPNNVTRELNRIAEATGGQRFWIDMETRIRNQFDGFDLQLCESVLESCNEHFSAAAKTWRAW